jgi:predicted permease
MRTAAAASLPGIEAARVNAPVLLFAGAISFITGLLAGVVPALIASRRPAHQHLRSGARGTADRTATWAQSALVFVEIAACVVLLTGAGLMIHSFARLASTDPGFRPDHVLTASVAASEADYPDAAQVLRFYDGVLHQLRSIPGVSAAAVATHLPFSGQKWGNGYEVKGQQAPRGRPWLAQIRPVSSDYFRALGIPLRRGEGFTEHDRQGSQAVAVVNESLARRHWPGEDAVGKRIEFQGSSMVIRGVVTDIRHTGLESAADPEIYIPYPQLPPTLITFLGRGMTLLIHSSLEPSSLVKSLRDAVHAVDAHLAVREIETMDELIAATIAQPRLRASLLAAFSAFAVLLATLGVYGLMSYAVTQRTPEMGVRLALGASPGSLVWLVVSRALLLACLGVAGGVTAAMFLARLMESLLYEVEPYDPLSFVGAPALLVAFALLASAFPARRAAAVDPVISLRAE